MVWCHFSVLIGEVVRFLCSVSLSLTLFRLWTMVVFGCRLRFVGDGLRRLLIWVIICWRVLCSRVIIVMGLRFLLELVLMRLGLVLILVSCIGDLRRSTARCLCRLLTWAGRRCAFTVCGVRLVRSALRLRLSVMVGLGMLRRSWRFRLGVFVRSRLM